MQQIDLSRYVAVITARAASNRLPGKNMRPLNGIPLLAHSLVHAQQAGLKNIVLSTDIEEAKEPARKMGVTVVDRPPELATDDCSHKDTILHAMEAAGFKDKHCILLQPTSPFRTGNIIRQCIAAFEASKYSATVLSSAEYHGAYITTDSAGGHSTLQCGAHPLLWDGCVAIYPAGKICDYTDVVPVRNRHVNTLQVDTEEDYIDACHILHTLQNGARPSFPAQAYADIKKALDTVDIKPQTLTLVARPVPGEDVPQDMPVVYLNHCKGYTGGRCDILFVVANENIIKVGINPELRECAQKAKLVIIRNKQYKDQLLEILPEIKDKYISIDYCMSQMTNHVTTGAIAAQTFAILGYTLRYHGFARPAIRNDAQDLPKWHYAGASLEIAMLRDAGAW